MMNIGVDPIYQGLKGVHVAFFFLSTVLHFTTKPFSLYFFPALVLPPFLFPIVPPYNLFKLPRKKAKEQKRS